MKPAWKYLLGGALTAMLLAGCGEKTGSLDPDLARFITTKQRQAHALADSQKAKLPAAADKLFTAILADDWNTTTNLFGQLDKARFGPPALPSMFQRVKDWVVARLQKVGLFRNAGAMWNGMPWEPIREAYWMYVLSKTWQKPRLEKIVHEITATIGTNSIYFGGTDPGRFAITAAMASHQEGRPCFVLTQNALADGTYLAYLGSMFSNHIYVPTQTDSQQAFQTYLADAQRRLQAGKLKKGENVVVTGGGGISISGQVAVMEINALLMKVIFDQNTNRDIYLEQSFPLSWTYPHLVPTGPIFRMNREPLARLPDSVLHANRAYWSNQCATLIGNWITEKTTVAEVCDFVERVYSRRELAGFKGDSQYLQDRAAQEYLSKLRHSTADLYAWRSSEAADEAEKQRMLGESLLAFQQAFALGPGNYNMVDDFSGMLAQIKHFDDGERLVRVSAMLNPTNISILHRLEETKSGTGKSQ